MGNRSHFLALIPVGIFMLCLSFMYTRPAQASDLRQETEKYCLSCHTDPQKSITLTSGETLSLFIEPDRLHQSVHSQAGIECEACHTNITTYPHPTQEYG